MKLWMIASVRCSKVFVRYICIRQYEGYLPAPGVTPLKDISSHIAIDTEHWQHNGCYNHTDYSRQESYQ